MLTEDLVDLPIEVMGGYCPSIVPSVLPPGASPLAQDCYFPEGGVATRPGLYAIFGPGNGIPNTAQILGLKTYMNQQNISRLMVWDSAGNLYKEAPDGTLNFLFARPQGAGTLYQSTTLFGREYQAFFGLDPVLGLDIPRQYDDVNWDRVSQVGPGISPTVNDSTVNANIEIAPNGLLNQTLPYNNVVPAVGAGLIYNPIGPYIIITASSGNFLACAVGDTVIIAGAGIPDFDGSWVVLACPASTSTIPANQLYVTTDGSQGGVVLYTGGGTVNTQIVEVVTSTIITTTVGSTITIATASDMTYDGTFPVRIVTDSQHTWIYIGTIAGEASSGGGTITLTGHISAGLHQVSVCFITRQGYITQAAPPSNWTAGGNLGASVTNIPIGPYNVIARLLLFTPVITAPATTGTFYSIPNGTPLVGFSAMMINDNFTTSTIVDFTDVILISSFQAEYLFTEMELGECASSGGYNSRLVWVGERNKNINFNNLTFDGGWMLGSGTGGSDVPLGWTSDPINGAGGTRVAGPSANVDWGDAYQITGDGISAIRGMITQNSFQNYLNVPILSVNTAYSARIRLISGGNIANCDCVIEVYSPSAGSIGMFIVATAAISTTEFTEFSGALITQQASLPNDIILRYYLWSGSWSVTTNGGWVIADNIEVYPTLLPYNFSIARFSHAFNPESYDATTGQVQVRPNDGQSLHCSFPLRSNLYLAKDHYLAYVTDDGINEPAAWAVNEVSATVGICGPNAIDWNEEWAVFAERSGLYIFWGSDPVKISDEFQQDGSNTGKVCWNSINWEQKQAIWVRIDRINKQILVGVPIGETLYANTVFMIDYKWLDGAADIASSPIVTYSSFTGKILAHGRGRRWMLWNINAPSMWFAERDNGGSIPFFGNGVGNGKLYEQLPGQYSDDGVAINSFYSTYYSPSHVEEQMVQLKSHRKLLGYLKWRAIGSGILAISVTTTLRTTNLRGYILSTTPAGDGERGIQISGERFSITFGTNAVGSWFQLEQVIPCVKKHPTTLVRGTNQ